MSRRRLVGASAGLAAAGGLSLAATAPAASAAAAGAAKKRDSRLALVTLGVLGGPPVYANHFGISSALVVNGRTYVVDCGRGSVSQFFRAGLDIASLSALFITHMHVDHTIDYISYLQLCGGLQTPNQFRSPVDAYGPGAIGDLGTPPPGIEWAYPTSPGITEMTELQMHAFGASTNLFLRERTMTNDRSHLLRPHDIAIPPAASAGPDNVAPSMDPFLVMDDGNVRVSAILVPHAKAFPAFALRFDTEHGSVTFSGDTALSDNLIKLAHRTDVLVHEAANIPFFENAGIPEEVLEHHKASHTNITDVGTVARDAEARHLVLSHIGPAETTANEWAARLRDSCARAGYRGKAEVGVDGADVRIR